MGDGTCPSMSEEHPTREEILRLVRAYAKREHGRRWPADEEAPRRPAFRPGEDPVPYAGRVFTDDEVAAAVGASLDFWLTLGTEGDAFERELAAYLGVKHSLLVNSGSSANLLALAALTSPGLKERQLRPGNEVITVAADSG